MMMAHPHSTNHEITTMAKELYEQQIRRQVEANNLGKYLVIEVETGDYEIDADEMVAMQRAAERHPGGALAGIKMLYGYHLFIDVIDGGEIRITKRT